MKILRKFQIDDINHSIDYRQKVLFNFYKRDKITAKEFEEEAQALEYVRHIKTIKVYNRE